MFKSHLEMIGRNETPSKKAKFWTSYIRSLKGSEDIRAHETPRFGRPYSSYLDAPATYRSIFDEPITAQDRVLSHGYRYLPVSRDTYGYSPRAIYDHHYSRTIPATYEAERAWNEHLRRMQEIERRYPSRYGLYLRDKPYTPHSLVPLEFEPEDKMLQDLNRARRSPSPMVGPNRVQRAGSEPYVPPPSYWSRGPSPPRGRSMTRGPSVFDRATSLAPFTRPLFRASSLEPLDELFARKLERPNVFERAGSPSPTPVKAGRWGPRPTEVAFDADGLPIFHPRNRFRDMFDPNPATPISAFTRDPFWWDIEDLAPFRAGSPFRGLSLPPRGSSVARDSFLSPVKNRYLWAKHPARPLTPHRLPW
uniref:Myofilin n=1 Tax=Glossina brevipalpis TaxID=37001 RepID=A0A1A9W1J7_9MUSC